MHNILVTGANGQLGSELQVLNDRFLMLDYKCFFTTKDELDITNTFELERFVKQNFIKTIINCASYTAVDKAEKEKELCELINHQAVKNLALISKQNDISLIHISSDYVFDGESYKPYLESDKTDPINFYGLTKLKGEEAIKKIAPKNSAIIRTSWVYSKYGNNFVKTILKLASELQEIRVIFDQVGTPTYAKDLAKVILQICQKLNNKKPQIYHYSNEGVCSWYDFAHEIIKIKVYECKILPIHTKEYPTLAKRPHISLLDKTKIKKDFGIEIPYWRDSLEKMLNERC